MVMLAWISLTPDGSSAEAPTEATSNPPDVDPEIMRPMGPSTDLPEGDILDLGARPGIEPDPVDPFEVEVFNPHDLMPVVPDNYRPVSPQRDWADEIFNYHRYGIMGWIGLGASIGMALVISTIFCP